LQVSFNIGGDFWRFNLCPAFSGARRDASFLFELEIVWRLLPTQKAVSGAEPLRSRFLFFACTPDPNKALLENTIAQRDVPFFEDGLLLLSHRLFFGALEIASNSCSIAFELTGLGPVVHDLLLKPSWGFLSSLSSLCLLLAALEQRHAVRFGPFLAGAVFTGFLITCRNY